MHSPSRSKKTFLTPKTTAAEAAKFFISEKRFGREPLNPKMPAKGLAELLRRFRGEPWYLELVEFVAGHPRANDAVHGTIMRITKDPAVLNAIATSKAASPATLRRLVRSPNQNVRGHARLAILTDELRTAPAARIRRILSRHGRESGIDIGVRMLLASHRRTPADVIDALMSDDVDLVRTAAEKAAKRRRAKRRRSPKSS
jgi:hypothetical protein